jgi:hypothetical protein
MYEYLYEDIETLTTTLDKADLFYFLLNDSLREEMDHILRKKSMDAIKDRTIFDSVYSMTRNKNFKEQTSERRSFFNNKKNAPKFPSTADDGANTQLLSDIDMLKLIDNPLLMGSNSIFSMFPFFR